MSDDLLGLFDQICAERDRADSADRFSDETALDDTSSMLAMVRCKCGELFFTHYPTICACGDRKAYWRTIEGKVLKLSQMPLGHLSNSIRMLAEKVEKYPAGQRERFEIALDILYAELGARDKEINQANGILSALNKSLAGL